MKSWQFHPISNSTSNNRRLDVGRCDQRHRPEHVSEAHDHRAAESGSAQSARQQGHAGPDQPDSRSRRDRQAHEDARLGAAGPEHRQRHESDRRRYHGTRPTMAQIDHGHRESRFDRQGRAEAACRKLPGRRAVGRATATSKRARTVIASCGTTMTANLFGIDFSGDKAITTTGTDGRRPSRSSFATCRSRTGRSTSIAPTRAATAQYQLVGIITDGKQGSFVDKLSDDSARNGRR